MRFRSIPFSRPTSSQTISARTDRSSAYRDDEDRSVGKVYQSNEQKRKVAYVVGDVKDEAAGGANAYIVFAHLKPDETQKPMHPREALNIIVERANVEGCLFESRTLRLGHSRQALTGKGASISAQNGVPKEQMARTVYVGNLGYAAGEHELRKFIEDLLLKERGPVEVGQSHVEDVRIIRDPHSGMGKGFAYVLLRVRSFSIFKIYRRLRACRKRRVRTR